VVGHGGTTGEGETIGKQILANGSSKDPGPALSMQGLTVHGLPKGPHLNVLTLHGLAQFVRRKPRLFRIDCDIGQPVVRQATLWIVRVTNTGHLAADAGTLALWEASPSYNSLAATPDQTVSVGVVNPGDVVELTFPALRAPDNQGTYHARVVVDYHGAEDEYSVGNNQGGATYTVFPLRALIEPNPAGTGVRITWNSSGGYTYHVERSTTLGPGGWTDISGPLPATAPENVYVDPASGTYFYRVWGTR